MWVKCGMITKAGEEAVKAKEKAETEATKKTLGIFRDDWEVTADDSSVNAASAIRSQDILSRRLSVQVDGLNRRAWMEYQTAQAANLMLEASIYAIEGQRNPLQLLGFVVNRALVTRITSLLLAAAASGIVSFVTTWYSDHY